MRSFMTEHVALRTLKSCMDGGCDVEHALRKVSAAIGELRFAECGKLGAADRLSAESRFFLWKAAADALSEEKPDVGKALSFARIAQMNWQGFSIGHLRAICGAVGDYLGTEDEWLCWGVPVFDDKREADVMAAYRQGGTAMRCQNGRHRLIVEEECDEATMEEGLSLHLDGERLPSLPFGTPEDMAAMLKADLAAKDEPPKFMGIV